MSEATDKETWSARVVEPLPFNHEFALGQPSKSVTEWPAEEKSDRAQNLEKLSFDMTKFNNGDLLLNLYDMFFKLNLVQDFSIPEEKLKKFLLTVHACYREVPFHNFRHAFNVAQAYFAFCFECDLKSSLSEKELLCLLLSTICHDLDHRRAQANFAQPGFNNAIQVGLSTELAVLYNDKSVLENHHAAMAFRILSKPESNILAKFTQEEFKTMRRMIVECIISTDLALHKDYLEKLKTVNAENKDEPDSRTAMLCAIIKCADLANEIRPTHSLSQEWASAVMTEFFKQGDLEKEKGLPVGMLNDREKATTPGGQVGFIKFLCMPLYTETARLFDKMNIPIQNMTANLKTWEEEVAAAAAKDKQ